MSKDLVSGAGKQLSCWLRRVFLILLSIRADLTVYMIDFDYERLENFVLLGASHIRVAS